MQMLKNWNPEQIREKEDIKVRLSAARTRLYELQMALKEHKIPVIVLFEGWGASGKGSTISKVIKNIDPRFFKVATMSAPTEEDLRKPFLYRYFREIPEAGKFTFLDSGWMDQTCRERMDKKLKGDNYSKRIDSIRRFERQLTDNGYVLLKFFMQIDRKEQEKRMASFWKARIPDGESMNMISGRMIIIRSAERFLTSICRIPIHLRLHGILSMPVTGSGQNCRYWKP